MQKHQSKIAVRRKPYIYNSNITYAVTMIWGLEALWKHTKVLIGSVNF